VPASQRGSGVLAIRDVVAAGDSLTGLESLLNRSHPGRVRRLPWRRLRWEPRNASTQSWKVFANQSRCGRYRCWQRSALGGCVARTGPRAGAGVRLFHGGFVRFGGLAEALRDQDGRDGGKGEAPRSVKRVSGRLIAGKPWIRRSIARSRRPRHNANWRFS
jgi:hypothetical protein